MRFRSTAVLCLLGCLLAGAPARAAAAGVTPTPTAKPAKVPPRPTSLAYTFKRGPVRGARNLQLALDIHRRDAVTPANNGDWKVGVTAKLKQFVVQGNKDGSGDVQAAFSEPTTRINGQEVRNAVPDVDVKTGLPISFIMHANRDGTCRPCLNGVQTAKNAPPGIDANVIYNVVKSGSGYTPQRVWLGDYLNVLHPSLPATPAALARPWYTPVRLSLCGTLVTLQLRSRLQLQHNVWAVQSDLDWSKSLTVPAAQCEASHQLTLLTGAPVTIGVIFGVHSSLTVQGVQGYPLPIDGIYRLKLVFSQGGAQLLTSDTSAHLTLSGTQVAAPGH